MVEPASGFIRLIPPFGQDGIFQEMQQMRCVGGNFKKFMSMIDRLFGSLGIQYPYFHRPQQDKVVRGFGVQIPRTHHGCLAVEKINAIATDPKTINRTSIVVLWCGRRYCEISDKKARQTRNGRSHPNNHNNKQQTTYIDGRYGSVGDSSRSFRDMRTFQNGNRSSGHLIRDSRAQGRTFGHDN